MAYGALVERIIPMSRKEFFARLADFGGIGKFMPEVESVEMRGDGVGAVRTVRIKGIPVGMEERLEALVDGRLLSYSIINETPLPLERYHAVVELDDAPGRRLPRALGQQLRREGRAGCPGAGNARQAVRQPDRRPLGRTRSLNGSPARRR
jgi:hypothetical protein